MEAENTGHNPRSPAQLVARIKAGEARAEEELVEFYGRGVMLILDRQTGGRPEAEDLYQETFSTALFKLRRGELRDPSKLPGFLSQLARNITIDFYRKIVRRKTDADSEVVQEKAVVCSSQLDHLVEHEQAALVRRVIAELRNERDRQLLFRFYIAEEDKEQILADFDLSSSQFNRVLHRARQRYKELYREHLATSSRVPEALVGIVWGAVFAYLVSLRQWGSL